MKLNKQTHLYASRSRSTYLSEDPHSLILLFRDDVGSADGRKGKKFVGKGPANNQINAFIMQYLQKQGVDTHFDSLLSQTQCVIRRLDMIPVECVIRNQAAGSICHRLGARAGTVFDPPVFEFFLKDARRFDPLINEHHIEAFNWANKDEIGLMQTLSFKINEILYQLFYDAGIFLVDFKVEFGRNSDQLFLGDVFTPDNCRFLDIKTRRKMGRDKVHHDDMGNLVEAYEEIAQRLGVELFSGN